MFRFSRGHCVSIFPGLVLPCASIPRLHKCTEGAAWALRTHLSGEHHDSTSWCSYAAHADFSNKLPYLNLPIYELMSVSASIFWVGFCLPINTMNDVNGSTFNFESFLFTYLCMCMCACLYVRACLWACMCHSWRSKDNMSQFSASTMWLLGLNSDPQALQEVPLPSVPSLWTKKLVYS